jgi:hypothetical protein
VPAVGQEPNALDHWVRRARNHIRHGPLISQSRAI